MSSAPDLTAIGACAEAAIGYALTAAKIVDDRITSVSFHLGNPEIPTSRFWVVYLPDAGRAGTAETLAGAIADAQDEAKRVKPATGEGQP